MGPPHLHEFDQMAQVYSVCTLVLLVKYTFSQFYGVVPEEHPAEDVWYFFFPPIRAVEEVPPDRKRRHWINDIENLPFHLIVFWAAFLLQCFENASGYGGRETLALTILFVIYSGSRVFFTAFYLSGITPVASIFFQFSIWAVFGAGALLVAAGFNINFENVFARTF